MIRSRRKRALAAAVGCAAAGTVLILLSLGGIGGMFDALSQIGAAVAFAAAAIFLIVSVALRRRSHRHG